MITRVGLAKTRHQRLFAFELRHWGLAARMPWQDWSKLRFACVVIELHRGDGTKGRDFLLIQR